jgi:hypothetical protein
MTIPPHRPPLSDRDESSKDVWTNTLAWAWVPAEDEAAAAPRPEGDCENELWMNWEIDGGEIDAAQGEPKSPHDSAAVLPRPLVRK